MKVTYRETQRDQKQEDIKEPEPVGDQTEKDQKTQVDQNTTTSSYKIQLGAFSSLDSANAWKSKLENKLNLKGLVIIERSGVYRVLYGNFNNIEDAVKELVKLKNINIYGFIVQE
ncbi:SPOR domain-containing protein [Escherichia coli]|nr:SPOR domain-containing protein [Escherichia coli]